MSSKVTRRLVVVTPKRCDVVFRGGSWLLISVLAQ
ncbi:hypothetical protein R3I93_015577 [Phoxinus phoxinus]|uniref:Uncharacterized protein n=1 Tax=Phoxinus phoxinus TaxID=58324 RepID=A0AAN9H0K0_9TELE